MDSKHQSQNTKLIFDIGFHKGEDTAFFLKKGYNVVAVEANPLLAEEGEIRFAKEIQAGRVTILNKGIAPFSGAMPFYVNEKNSQWSSFDFEIGSRNNTPYHTIEVPTITSASLIEQYGIPFYIKIDIEGYDKYVLEGLPENVAELPQYISCEATEFELVDKLFELGYRKFKLIHQGDDFRQMNLQRESTKWFPLFVHYYNGIKKHLGKWIPFKYEYGASGPFGENTHGQWQDYDTIKTDYMGFYQKDKTLNSASWFDFHASK